MTFKTLFAGTACLALIACSSGSADTIEVSDAEDYAAWHEANGKRKGVVTLESGLQYKIIKKGVKNGPSPVGPQVIRANAFGSEVVLSCKLPLGM